VIYRQENVNILILQHLYNQIADLTPYSSLL